ncbi:MAG: AMP-binding protein [Clostridia bacterium]|nr:AMP-binding protein [Clostridia bacterium]
MKKVSLLYNCISLFAEKSPEKIALIGPDGQKAGFSDFLSVYHSIERFINRSNINEVSRIAILMNDVINMGLSVLPVMGNAILVLIDSDMSPGQFSDYYNLINVDYIITDDLSSPGCIAAEKAGVGIILNRISGIMNQKVCEIELRTEKIVKYSDSYVVDADILNISTTSGTTSTPKLVPTTYKQYFAALDSRIRNFEFTSNDVALIVTKLYKMTALNAMLTTVSVGGTAVISNGFNHSTFIRLIRDNKVTTMTISPAILSSYADYIRENGIEFNDTSLRFIRASGAPLSRKLKEYLESVLKTPIEQSYGMTEVKNISSTYKAPKGYKEGSAGVSTLLDVKIRDGEILVKGVTVFEGYLNKDIDNSKYFTDGWFHTGDMGYIDEDGYIFITGRIKEMINRGGEKISPYEVENAILKHSDISDAVVFPYPNSFGSEDAGAVIVLSPGKNMDLISLRKFLNGKVSAYKMPSILYIVKEIPRSNNDKVQRKMMFDQLSELYPEQNRANNEKIILKQTKTEKEIRKIWIKVLKKKNFGNDVTFMDLGGDSLNGEVVLSQIEHNLNVRIPVNVLFNEGTIKSVAEYIESAGHSSVYKFLVPVKESGEKKPLICVHSGTGDEVTYRHIGKNIEEERPVYAIRFDMKNFKWKRPLTFEELAKVYSEEIKKLDPEGPYYLCGNCWGGVLAFKIASYLKENGSKIGLLAMIDSADKGKKKGEKNSGLLRHIYNTFFESLDQLKELGFKDKIMIILKKTSNIFNLVRLSQNKRIYAYGNKRNNTFLMNLSGRAGALGYAYQNYHPEFYKGTVHYFKATKGTSGRNRNEEYWAEKSEDFIKVELECHHNDMVIGENSKKLTDKISEIIER